MRPVLISSDSGSGRPADEALLASAVRLLARGARSSVFAVTRDISKSTLAHPDLRFVSEPEIDAALEESALLVVVGDLTHEANVERAALHVARAKLAAVPTALVAARLPVAAESERTRALMPFLAQCESLSAADATTARRLACQCGGRVDTTAPLELLLELDEVADPPPPPMIGVSGECLARTSKASGLVQALRRLSSSEHARVVVLDTGSGCDCEFETHSFGDWNSWLQALTSLDLWLDEANSIASSVAATHGVRPIAVVDPEQSSALHARIGLAKLVVPRDADAETVARQLQIAHATPPSDLRSRCATLRTVAWRALGPLAESTSSRPLDLKQLDSAGRAFLAGALGARVRTALESGSYLTAEQDLARWRDQLEEEPRWLLAQAHFTILQGREGEARALLERAVARDPVDVECQATLAMVLWRLGEVQAAEAVWHRVAQLEPHSARAPYQIGCLELLRGRMQRAIRAWDEARSREQESAEEVESGDLAPRLGDGAA
ncbi:MAG: tetratricopeptide repeat protein [Candidatus Latescibacterota bacterium]|nr:MAG: tetratricopeptide repeat protein [Candidatus Latescibacterota bacterium]